jgi:hypothetical protein
MVLYNLSYIEDTARMHKNIVNDYKNIELYFFLILSYNSNYYNIEYANHP